MTIEPTVTPAPKPEWPDLVTYICRDTDGDIFPCRCPREEMAENQLVHLATVTIPSSAECERKAKIEAARTKLEEAVNWFFNPPPVGLYEEVPPDKNHNARLFNMRKSLEQLQEIRKLEQEAP